MRLLLCGPMAEDGRYPVWQHVALPLRQLGHTLLAFDPITAISSSKDQTADRQLDWYFNSYQPEQVIDLTNTDLIEQFANKNSTPYLKVSAPHLNVATEGKALEPRLNLALFHEAKKDNFVADISIVTSASPNAVATTKELANTSAKVQIHGFGWESNLSADRFTFYGAPYSDELAARIRTAPKLLCLPNDKEHSVPSLDLRAQVTQAIAAGIEPLVDNKHRALVPQDLHGQTTFYDTIDNIDFSTTEFARPTTHLEDAATDPLWANLGIPEIKVNEYKPKVSVLLSSYNVAEYLPESIESILNQTEQDFEIVACNDGSTDNSAKVIEKYTSDPRVRLIDQQNIGQTGRFDTIWNGLNRFSRSDYIAHLGADDRMRSDRLQKQLQCFEDHPSLDVCHSAAQIIDENGNVVSGGAFTFAESYSQDSLARMELTYNLIGAPSIMVKTNIYDRIAQWENGYSCDFHYWLKSASNLRYQFVPLALTQWRQHQKSASTGYDLEITMSQGMRVWAAERLTKTIFDLYPALLLNNADNRGIAAAYTDLAVRLLSRIPQPSLAIQDLDRAQALIGIHPIISLTRAIALNLAGDSNAALNELEIARNADPAITITVNELIPDYLPRADRISTDAFLIPRSERHNFWVWDGTTADIERILIVPHFGDLRNMTESMQRFVDTFTSSDPVELVIPTLGASPDLVANAVAEAARTIKNLDSGAGVIIEEVDELSTMPLSRFIGLLNLQDGRPISEQLQSLDDISNQVRNRIRND